MNRFVSEEALKTEADRIAAMSKADREWEALRSGGASGDLSSGAAGSSGSSGPSLYDQLRAKGEKDAADADDKHKEETALQVLDEDEARFFNDQKRRERDDDRRLEREVDSFKKAAAMASASHKSEPALLSMIKPRAESSPIAKKISPLAKISAVKPITTSTSTTSSSTTIITAEASTTSSESKKRSAEDIEKDAPATKKNLTVAAAAPAQAKIPLVKYNRNDDDE